MKCALYTFEVGIDEEYCRAPSLPVTVRHMLAKEVNLINLHAFKDAGEVLHEQAE